MQTRPLGSTGLTVSVVGVGGWQIGGPDRLDATGVGHGWGDVDDERSVRLLHRAEELGVNLVDTADVYGNGHSENVIGRALRGRRHRWVIATKGGLVKTPGVRGQHVDTSPGALRAACQASLRRLQTDYVDVWQLHAPPAPDQIEAVAEQLLSLQQAGAIRAIGISTGSVADVQALAAVLPVGVVQVGFNLVHRGERPVLEHCAAGGIGTLVRSPLMWGAAFGRYADGAPRFQAGDLRAGTEEAVTASHAFGRRFSFLWGEATGRSPAQAALRYVLDQRGVTAAIPGMRTLEQLEDDAAAGEIPTLSKGELAGVEAVLAG